MQDRVTDKWARPIMLAISTALQLLNNCIQLMFYIWSFTIYL